MKTIGIIAEYNPFHLGHLYQINKIKEMYPESTIIAIISTHFTQRGDISILNKWDKTRICLENNIDIIVELPTIYATQSGDIFASSALKILNELKIDTLVFGSESNDIEKLYKLANIQLNDDNYNKLVKDYLDSGINYPTAMSKALKDIANITIDTPNDLLGLSYIKEIIKNNYKIEAVSIKRSNDYHGIDPTNNIISANLIRKLLLDNTDITSHIPKITNKYIYHNLSINKAFPLLKYQIINNINNLNTYLTTDEGIENRLIKYINKSNSWEELIMNTKTKRYTYNKIGRTLIHILLGIKKEDNNQDIYIRILGFNKKGQVHIKNIKKEITLPIFTGYKPNISKSFDIEFKSTTIYSIILNEPNLINEEYHKKPIIK